MSTRADNSGDGPGGARTDDKADRDLAARRALRRQKRLATGLLGGMAALAVAGISAGPGFWPQLLAAAAKAGLVGGLADWFAVTALFRRPLGLPIPHTAIIPAQKERLGRALGNFVGNHVLTESEVDAALARLDLPSLLGAALEDPALAAGVERGVVAAMPHLLASLEDGRARELTARALGRVLDGGAAAPAVARALRALVDGDRHQDVLSFLLDQIRALLRSRETHLRTLIEERVREQGGRLVGWAIGGSVATRVLAAINSELDRSDSDDSELRDAVTEWMRREIDLIETDPDRAQDLGATLRSVLTHDSIRAWGADVWQRLRGALEADLHEPDNWVSRLSGAMMARLRRSLAEDPETRRRVESFVRALVLRSLPSLRERMAGFIARVVGGWNGAEITDRLELRVGPDLQFVRINGTLVGFLVGGGLFLLERLFGPGGRAGG
ncbi:DUF445 domain-containing protein [Rhizosaccharibacter radicis]|uniref:DUF445 domain-containing protein n=1 Tax=Rhizosaccharibacter radicis TaxID=2782605 RepID=A0ABT1VYF4_9PROT|nr:DUF445 domain-containing protein [Acetobacteraceae bacterium KSS12]